MLKRSGKLDLLFTALGDPVRRAMVERLSEGAVSVSSLARPLAISLSSAMQHLAVLEACGLVKTRKRGRVRICQLDAAALGQVERWLAQRAIWTDRLIRLERLMGEQQQDV